MLITQQQMHKKEANYSMNFYTTKILIVHRLKYVDRKFLPENYMQDVTTDEIQYL